MAEIIIGGLIAAWAVYVIYKKIRQIRSGRYCSCCEGDCAGCKRKQL